MEAGEAREETIILTRGMVAGTSGSVVEVVRSNCTQREKGCVGEKDVKDEPRFWPKQLKRRVEQVLGKPGVLLLETFERIMLLSFIKKFFHW